MTSKEGFSPCGRGPFLWEFGIGMVWCDPQCPSLPPEEQAGDFGVGFVGRGQQRG